MKRSKITVAIIFLMVSIATQATDQKESVDPSNLTKTFTQAFMQLDSDSNIKLGGSISGQFNSHHQYMGGIETSLGKTSGNIDNNFGASYLGSRTQFFGALSTNIKFSPKVGYSLDYSHFTDGTTLTAVGGLFLVNPVYTKGFMIFPNLAYAVGTIHNGDQSARGDFFGAIEEFPLPNTATNNIDVDGVLLNIFVSKKLNANGTFIMAWPEYVNVSGGGLSVKQITLKVNFGMPINEAKNWWFNVMYELKQPNIRFLNETIADSTKTKIYLGVKRYF